jgi:hypothetical protein
VAEKKITSAISPERHHCLPAAIRRTVAQNRSTLQPKHFRE